MRLALRHFTFAVALGACAAAHAYDPKETIADLDARLAKLGAPKVEGTDMFIRVSTNVLTPEGKRGIGTLLARNKAYDAVAKGEAYCGPIDVLGTAFDACYNPIKDASGKIVGVSYIGHKK